jgi:hypothetical protein
MSVTRLPFRKKLALNLFSRYRKNESKIHQLNYILWGMYPLVQPELSALWQRLQKGCCH